MNEERAASAATGIHGLDDVLGGGLTPRPGVPARRQPGHRQDHDRHAVPDRRRRGRASAALYITLSETEDELRASAASHGWSLDGIEIFELVPPESLLDEDQQQSLLYSSDLELGETTKRIFEAFERVQARAGRARQPVRDPAAGAKLAALPPPDPGAEALFRRAAARPC